MESRVRASTQQFSAILEFMESHGDLAKPGPGPQGRLKADSLWIELATSLNSMRYGVRKIPEKWKKVWADWKTKTKKKAYLIRRHTSDTSGKSRNINKAALTAFEERVLAIMGISADRNSNIEDQRSNRDPLSTAHTQTQWPPATQDSPQSANEVPKNESSQSIGARRRQPERWNYRQSARTPSPSRPRSPSSPPPSSNTKRRTPTPTMPQPRTTGPRRPLRMRPRLTRIPYDRTASEFMALELRRLQVQETRDRQLHERESRRIEVDHERNVLLRSVIDIAKTWLDCYQRRDNASSSTDTHYIYTNNIV